MGRWAKRLVYKSAIRLTGGGVGRASFCVNWGTALEKHKQNIYIIRTLDWGQTMAKGSRFKKLVHYVCYLCDDQVKLGATKLNKILWYVDAFAYRLWGETISGEKAYVKRQFGPVPRNILRTLESLEREGAIRIRETEYFGRQKRDYVLLKDARDDAFTEEEKALIKKVVQVVCDNHTVASISDVSHDLIWEAAGMGEDIPVNAVLAAQTTPPTGDDEKWAGKIISERVAGAKQTTTAGHAVA